MPLSIPPRRWQVSAQDFPLGPHEEDDVLAAIDRGDLVVGHCRPVGDLRWRKLEEEAPFAMALRRVAHTGTFPVVR